MKIDTDLMYKLYIPGESAVYIITDNRNIASERVVLTSCTIPKDPEKIVFRFNRDQIFMLVEFRPGGKKIPDQWVDIRNIEVVRNGKPCMYRYQKYYYGGWCYLKDQDRHYSVYDAWFEPETFQWRYLFKKEDGFNLLRYEDELTLEKV